MPETTLLFAAHGLPTAYSSYVIIMSTNATLLEFNEEWAWGGWTTLDESVNDGAVDTDGNLVLVGSQGRKAHEFDDDTFVNELAGDFATVKMNGNSGQVMWTWVGSSSGSQADLMLSVDTDGNNDVRVGKIKLVESPNTYGVESVLVPARIGWSWPVC